MKERSEREIELMNAIEALPERGLELARITSVNRSGYTVRTGNRDMQADASGKLLFAIECGDKSPATGDWAAIMPVEGGDRAVIIELLPRRTMLARQTAGKRIAEQVIASNIDVIFIVIGLDGNYKPSRIERYLTAAKGSGAEAVVILTKADLHTEDELTDIVEEAQKSSGGSPVHAISSLSGSGIETVRDYLTPDITICFIGSSGVGKSTLINRLAGFDMLATAEVRGKDSKGRHTTTRRELIYFDNGSALIDTPGMREFGIWDDSADVGAAFTDIEALTENCRFADCKHENEPGCAILEAIEDGSLDPKRFKSYKKLLREVRFASENKREYLREKDNLFKGYHKMTKEIYRRKGRL